MRQKSVKRGAPEILWVNVANILWINGARCLACLSLPWPGSSTRHHHSSGDDGEAKHDPAAVPADRSRRRLRDPHQSRRLVPVVSASAQRQGQDCCPAVINQLSFACIEDVISPTTGISPIDDCKCFGVFNNLASSRDGTSSSISTGEGPLAEVSNVRSFAV